MSPGKNNKGGITLPSGGGADEEELDTLVRNNVAARVENESCFLQRIMLQIDEQVSVKLLMKVWGPRLELIVRLMLVATFLDDSVHSVMHFGNSTRNIAELGYPIKWFPVPLAYVFGAVFLSLGILTQFVGSFCILSLTHVDMASMALVAWMIAQPFLFGELFFRFVAESLSIIGGLLILQHVKGSASAQTQFIGRLLLPAVYLYDAGSFLLSSMVFEVTNSFSDFVSSLSIFFITLVVIGVLILGCGLISIGLRSRTVALVFALLNLFYVCYTHPFLRFLTIKDGEWQIKDNMWYPDVELPNGLLMINLDDWMIFNLHRYYFFQGLSVSGALFLLTQFGPGKIAAQKDETILPVVARAQD